METLFEAASWSASSSNLQPWHFAWADRGSQAFDAIVQCLNPSNQVWAAHAAVLVVSFVNTHTPKGTPNRYAEHDLGMATATMMLQAQQMDIYGRIMGGYQRELLNATLHIPQAKEPCLVIALGYLGSLAGKDEAFVQRELQTRQRKSTTEFAQHLQDDLNVH